MGFRQTVVYASHKTLLGNLYARLEAKLTFFLTIMLANG